MNQKIAIYGAGAIGGWMGAKLAAVGCEVGVVARGATLAALRKHGLRLREGKRRDAAPDTPSPAGDAGTSSTGDGAGRR